MIYSHYSSLMAEAMDRDRPNPDDGEMEYLQKYLLRSARNLELACGTGRLLFPIRQLGYDIYGIDSSPEMLARCRLKEEQYGFGVPTHRQFMQTFDLDMIFGLIFIGDCSFDLLYTEEDQRITLRNIMRHLQPGGVFLFDIETPPDPVHMASGCSKTWNAYDDGEVLLISEKIFRYDPVTCQRPGVQIHELYVGGEFIKKQAYYDPMRFNNPWAVEKMLAEEGFIDVAISRYLTDEPLQNDIAENVSIRCKRPDL